jgi:hypothetical protein
MNFTNINVRIWFKPRFCPNAHLHVWLGSSRRQGATRVPKGLASMGGNCQLGRRLSSGLTRFTSCFYEPDQYPRTPCNPRGPHVSVCPSDPTLEPST